MDAKLREFLESIKKPDFDPDDEQENVEQLVGDSVSEAYGEGLSDGETVGKYEFAQELLKKFCPDFVPAPDALVYESRQRDDDE